MQRRAAAAYVVFFVLIAAGSYAFIGTAQSPTVTFDSPDHELSTGDTFSVDGRTYTVTGLSEESGGEEGGDVSYAGTLEWTNESALYTESFENGDSIEIENTTYDVVIPNESEPGSVLLREQPGEDVETVERDGSTYVVVDQNGDGTDELIPIDEYDELDRRELQQGQTWNYNGTDRTVQITQESLTLRWFAPKTNEVDLSHTGNVTLNGQTYLTYFRSGSEVVLTTEFQSYQNQVAQQDLFHERMNGFWGVTILSGLAAIFLAGLAYLPHKDT